MDDREPINTGLTLADLRRLYPLVRKRPDDPGARILCEFYIEGEQAEREVCTRAVGFEPTQYFERRVRGTNASGASHIVQPSWTLAVVHEPAMDLEPCLEQLLARLWPRRSAIAALVARIGASAGINTNVVVFEDRPLCNLTTPTIRTLADLGVPWHFTFQDAGPP